MDDILIIGSEVEEMHLLSMALAQQFEMKALGTLKYFLGIEVAHSNAVISLGQHKYILDLLKETDMLGCQPTRTPLDVNVKGDGGTIADKTAYQRLIGKLIYLNHTCPDISFCC